LRETALYEPSWVKSIHSFFPVEDGKKERKGKAQKVTQTLYFTY